MWSGSCSAGLQPGILLRSPTSPAGIATCTPSPDRISSESPSDRSAARTSWPSAPGSIWPSCAPLGSSPATKLPVAQFLPSELHPFGIERGIEFGDRRVRGGGIVQVIAPSLERRAHKFCDDLGMLLQDSPCVVNITRYGLYPGVAGEQHARLDSRLLREKRLRRRERLLDVLRIGDEVRHVHHRRNFVNVVQLIALLNDTQTTWTRS